MIPLISALQIRPCHPVQSRTMHVRPSLMHYYNRSAAFECLIDLLGKISQILGTNRPDN